MDYPTRLLSDFWPHGEIGRRYGVFESRLGVNTRATFLLDAAGIVRRVLTSPELSKARDIDAYLEAIQSL